MTPNPRRGSTPDRPASVVRRARRAARRAIARIPLARRVLPTRVPPPAPPEDDDVVFCDSVLAWAEDHPGTAFDRIAPAATMPKPPARTIEPEIHPKFTESPVLRFAERYVAHIEGGRLELAPHAVWPPDRQPHAKHPPRVVLPDGAVSLESTQLVRKRYRPHPEARTLAMPGDYFPLIGPYSWEPNHYHWTHDILTSLHGVAPLIPADTRFVVPTNLGPVRTESLAMLGIDADRLVPFDLDSPATPLPSWRFDRLHFSPGPTGPCASPEALTWLRSEALAYADAADRRPHRRIYVSRRTARHRRAVNEEEVVAFLADRGFECHELDGTTLRDQIELFSEAAVLIGPHGAGHTNMLFARPGLVVIDILGSEVNKCFYHLAITLGHEYWYMMGDDVPSGSRYTDDIDVSIDKLDAITTLALAGD